MRGSLVFLLDGAIPSCSESGSRQGLCWGRHACHHTCALGLLCFLLCLGHIAWCPGVKLAPANLVGPKEGMEIKGLKGSYAGLLGSQMRQRQHGSHQVHPCLGHGSWADTGGALSEHRAFLGSLLLLRGVIGLLGSWNLSDKGQEQTLGASIPPCSIPGAPGTSVSGDFSASLFLDPTGSAVWGPGVAVTLLPEQVSGLPPKSGLSCPPGPHDCWSRISLGHCKTAPPRLLSTPVHGLVLLTEHLPVPALLLPMHVSGPYQALTLPPPPPSRLYPPPVWALGWSVLSTGTSLSCPYPSSSFSQWGFLYPNMGGWGECVGPGGREGGGCPVLTLP